MAGSCSRAAGANSVNLCSLQSPCERPGHTLSGSMPVSHGTPWPRCRLHFGSLSGAEVAARGVTSHLSPHIGSRLPVPSHYPYPCSTSDRLTSPPLPEELSTAGSATESAQPAMEMPLCSHVQLQEDAFLFDCEPVLDKSLYHDPASDPGYVSAGSSLSPTSTVDSFCFSPASMQAVGSEQDALDSLLFGTLESYPTNQAQAPLSSRSSSVNTSCAKKSRSRYPGKKRQTASEREKLRMRDLTKALHELRTYLPPSVAPAGQTLTKIETLRLTIRYISHLSAQLGLSEEVLEQRRTSGLEEQIQTLSQFLGQPSAGYSPQESTCTAVSGDQLSSIQSPCQVCSFSLIKRLKNTPLFYRTVSHSILFLYMIRYVLMLRLTRSVFFFPSGFEGSVPLQ
ncbi:uncharacterized protein ACNS7B_021293 [Menidia menidia]